VWDGWVVCGVECGMWVGGWACGVSGAVSPPSCAVPALPCRTLPTYTLLCVLHLLPHASTLHPPPVLQLSFSQPTVQAPKANGGPAVIGAVSEDSLLLNRALQKELVWPRCTLCACLCACARTPPLHFVEAPPPPPSTVLVPTLPPVFTVFACPRLHPSHCGFLSSDCMHSPGSHLRGARGWNNLDSKLAACGGGGSLSAHGWPRLVQMCRCCDVLSCRAVSCHAWRSSGGWTCL
jgi:hypothetical protein